LLKASYKWVLDHPDFRRWRDNKHSRLLWIKGVVGKGKTMLLIGIIEELSQQLKQLCGAPPDAGLLSFCQGTDSRLKAYSSSYCMSISLDGALTIAKVFDRPQGDDKCIT